MDAFSNSRSGSPGRRDCSSRARLDVNELRELIALSTEPLQRLAGASLLITGATGWFGTWLLDFFCAGPSELLCGLGIRIAALPRVILRPFSTVSGGFRRGTLFLLDQRRRAESEPDAAQDFSRT